MAILAAEVAAEEGDMIIAAAEEVVAAEEGDMIIAAAEEVVAAEEVDAAVGEEKLPEDVAAEEVDAAVGEEKLPEDVGNGDYEGTKNLFIFCYPVLIKHYIYFHQDLIP